MRRRMLVLGAGAAGFAPAVGWAQKDKEKEREEVRKAAQNAMNAVYKGVVPDTFKAEAEVVVKGKLDADGTIHIENKGITAKCPSKYEAAKAAPAVR